MRAGWTASGVCTSGATALPRGATRRASGGAAMTSISTKWDDRREHKAMCPVCIATAALIAGGVASMGGLAVAAIKKSGVKNAADNHSTPAQSQEDHHG